MERVTNSIFNNVEKEHLETLGFLNRLGLNIIKVDMRNIIEHGENKCIIYCSLPKTSEVEIYEENFPYREYVDIDIDNSTYEGIVDIMSPVLRNFAIDLALDALIKANNHPDYLKHLCTTRALVDKSVKILVKERDEHWTEQKVLDNSGLIYLNAKKIKMIKDASMEELKSKKFKDLFPNV